MSRKGLGMTTVVDDAGPRARHLHRRRPAPRARSQVDIHGTRMADVMTTECKVAEPRMLAAEAVHLMETYRITSLPVVVPQDERRLVGALNVHDLLRAGVM